MTTPSSYLGRLLSNLKFLSCGLTLLVLLLPLGALAQTVTTDQSDYPPTYAPACTPPSFTACPGPISANTGSGTCTATVNYTATATSTPAPTLTYAFTGATADSGSGTGSGSTFNKGVTTVTITAQNGCSPNATCSFTVTVNDATAPAVLCGNVAAQTANAAASCHATVPDVRSLVRAQSSDNCTAQASLNVTQNPVEGSTVSGTGSHPITVTVTDGAANGTQCVVDFTVNDTSAPAITCPANITQDNEPGVCGAQVTYTAPVGTDNCPDATTAQTAGLASGATFPVGTTVNTFTVTDAVGNHTECSFNVTVNDTEKPKPNCPANIVVETDLNECSASVSFAAAPTDNCGVASTFYQIGSTPITSPHVFPTGVTTVDVTVTDVHGNSDTCSFTVTVNDATPPVISSCGPNQSASADGNCQAAVPDFTARVTASDNCTASGSLTKTQSPTAGTLVGPGPHIITVTVKDAANNSSTCPATFTVNDTTAPTVTCGNVSAQSANADASCNATVPDVRALVQAQSSDNCTAQGSLLVTQSPLEGSTVNGSGPHPITVTVTDPAGNSSTPCIVQFMVNDVTKPSIACENVAAQTANADASCNATVPDVRSLVRAQSSDNCVPQASLNVTQDPGEGSTVSGTGPHSITVTVTDASANGAQCVVAFTVNDTIPPVITCPPTVMVSCPGDVPVHDFAGGATSDNCPGAVAVTWEGDVLSAQTCANRYTITRAYRATDVSGNFATCTQTITVDDTTVPVITQCAPSSTVQSASQVPAADDSAVVATDNCGGAVTVTHSTDTITPGNVTRTYTATDACGNTSSCVQTITINGTTPPAIVCPPDKQLQCGESTDPSNTGTATSTGGTCGGTVTISHTDAATPANCTGKVGIDRTWTATDACGSSNSCVQHITFVDTTAPVITCPENILVSNDGTCTGAIILDAGTVTATDNCGSATVVCTRSDGKSLTNAYPVGVTTITCTATDACTNTAACSHTVTVTTDKSIASNFNGTKIPGNSTIWFSAIIKPKLKGHCPATVTFSGQTIKSAEFNLVVPDAEIHFVAGGCPASTVFAGGKWITTVGCDFTGNIFLSGLAYVVPASGLPGGINPVAWAGTFAAGVPGVSLQWKWAAAVYTTFTADNNAIGVKQTDGNSCSTYNNSDHAGTPENFKPYVIGGARGGGGSNWTGSLSGTLTVVPCN